MASFFSVNVNHLIVSTIYDLLLTDVMEILFTVSRDGEKNKQGKMIGAHLCLINRSFGGLVFEVLFNPLL